ncbi:MAG: AbrB family transcriptional regulator [Deltaproteobacteria bacterium]|jgi:membrane AbrB-like protein|nr:AbrB family transcriptional regulator [Deltaproteobacteria bacterium]
MFSNPDTPILLLAAFCGGSLGKYAKIPGGALLFSTVAVAAVSLYGGLPHTPSWEMIMTLQLLTGCMLGQSINRRFWQDFLQIWRPTLVVIGSFTLMAAPFALFLVESAGFDALTAALAATPARMQDMIILAGSLDADAVTVMLMQLARQFAIIGITPFILAKYARETRKAEAGNAGKHAKTAAPNSLRAGVETYAMQLVPGLAGGVLGHTTGHILGPLLGAFFAVAASRILWAKAGETPFPRAFAFILQSLAGILLGSRITPDIGVLLLDRLLPLVTACLYVLIAGLIAARVLTRRYGWNKALSWMAAAPGRASDMLAMSQDIELSGRERLALVSIHTVRQIYFTLLISLLIALL